MNAPAKIITTCPHCTSYITIKSDKCHYCGSFFTAGLEFVRPEYEGMKMPFPLTIGQEMMQKRFK